MITVTRSIVTNGRVLGVIGVDIPLKDVKKNFSMELTEIYR